MTTRHSWLGPDMFKSKPNPFLVSEGCLVNYSKINRYILDRRSLDPSLLLHFCSHSHAAQGERYLGSVVQDVIRHPGRRRRLVLAPGCAAIDRVGDNARRPGERRRRRRHRCSRHRDDGHPPPPPPLFHLSEQIKSQRRAVLILYVRHLDGTTAVDIHQVESGVGIDQVWLRRRHPCS